MQIICEDEFDGERPHHEMKCFRIFSSYHEQIQLCKWLLPKCRINLSMSSQFFLQQIHC